MYDGSAVTQLQLGDTMAGADAAANVTIADLLGMQSGIYDFDDDETRR